MISSNFTNNTNVGSVLYPINMINLGFGGVLFTAGMNTIVSLCLFEGNSNKMGGVFSFSVNTATLDNVILIQNSTMINNRADQYGGVMYFPPGFIVVSFLAKFNLFQRNYALQSKFNLFFFIFTNFLLIF